MKYYVCMSARLQDICMFHANVRMYRGCAQKTVHHSNSILSLISLNFTGHTSCLNSGAIQCILLRLKNVQGVSCGQIRSSAGPPQIRRILQNGWNDARFICTGMGRVTLINTQRQPSQRSAANVCPYANRRAGQICISAGVYRREKFDRDNERNRA